MSKRLTETPEKLILGKSTAEYDHPSASAYMLVGDAVVWAPQTTHLVIFNVLKHRPTSQTLAEHGIHASPKLTAADLDWFEEHYTGVMGDMRERTHSGRAWRDVRYRGAKASVASFWTERKATPSQTVQRVLEALSLTQADHTFVEFMDSKRPQRILGKQP